MLRFCPFNLRIMEKDIIVREATRDDCLEIRQFIQELADFEEMSNSPKIDYQDLVKDGFDRNHPMFKCYVAVCEDKVVGYALFFYVYTTLDRKAIHLEDLYVTPNFRKKNVGSRLFDIVAKKTFEQKCQYLDFCVLSWNTAQGFYKAKGAMNMTELEGWHAYRFNRESLINLANKLTENNDYIVREATSDDLVSIRLLAEKASSTQNIRISKYKKPIFDEISVINVDETTNDTGDDFYGYFVVEHNDNIIGYALYCHTYSTWEGKAMYLQELYVSNSCEHTTNMKFDLLYAVAKRACDEDCCRIDFWLLDLKDSTEFYLANGAVDMTECEEWNMYRLFEITKKSA